MRFRWIQVFPLVLLSITFIACPLATTKPAETKPPTAKAMDTKTETLTGLVETGPDGVVITIDWTRKCRASYTVIGHLAGNFKKLIGKIVTATGTVTKTSPWSGTILVTSVQLKE